MRGDRINLKDWLHFLHSDENVDIGSVWQISTISSTSLGGTFLCDMEKHSYDSPLFAPKNWHCWKVVVIDCLCKSLSKGPLPVSLSLSLWGHRWPITSEGYYSDHRSIWTLGLHLKMYECCGIRWQKQVEFFLKKEIKHKHTLHKQNILNTNSYIWNNGCSVQNQFSNIFWHFLTVKR